MQVLNTEQNELRSSLSAAALRGIQTTRGELYIRSRRKRSRIRLAIVAIVALYDPKSSTCIFSDSVIHIALRRSATVTGQVVREDEHTAFDFVAYDREQSAYNVRPTALLQSINVTDGQTDGHWSIECMAIGLKIEFEEQQLIKLLRFIWPASNLTYECVNQSTLESCWVRRQCGCVN